MTTTIGTGIDHRGTDNTMLLAWVREVAERTTPEHVVCVDGSDEEWGLLTTALVDAGTFVRLDERKRPNSFWAASDPDDIARVEERTFICSLTKDGAGPTNIWVPSAEMKTTMTELYRGCMRGRTMYIVPFCMGQLDAASPMLGVEITDSEYVVASMKIMPRMGAAVMPPTFRRRAPGARRRRRPWPCSETKYISHFPETREVWSYGSGYGGNALLDKKCYALRIASAIARDEGWLAEYMLILKLISPQDKAYYVAVAFPSAYGKSNLAMLQPTVLEWRAETVGDDITWMRFGEDGRLYAVNLEFGFFGVAPGTNWKTNPSAMKTIAAGNSIFTNVALTDDGDVWWEGMDDEPQHLTSWLRADWTPESDEPAAHPNSRYTVPIGECPAVAPEWQDPQGVPILAILFGGRRKTTVALVTEARDWQHGTFMGATMSSEMTAAAKGGKGQVRRDPMAMLPFLGYNVGDYIQHWVNVGKSADADKLPKIFYLNWFRRGADGRFLWPRFGENSRVLNWCIERMEGAADAQEMALGYVPTPEQLDIAGLDAPAADVARPRRSTSRSGRPRSRSSRNGSTRSARSCPHRYATNSRSSSCTGACRSRGPARLIVQRFKEVRPMILHIRIAADATPPTGHAALYWCAKGHHTPRRWSTDVTAPELWECRCGLPAGRDRGHPPEPRTWRPFKSPLAHLLERRSEAECEALLDEALQRLRVRRGRGHPATAHVEPRS